MTTVTHIGELGAVGGMLRPFVFTVEKDGGVWDLTAYNGTGQWRIWDLRTKTIVAANGTLTVTDAVAGEVTYTPGTSDPIMATTGTFEARVWLQHNAGGDKEPSALHRFTIGAGPTPA